MPISGRKQLILLLLLLLLLLFCIDFTAYGWRFSFSLRAGYVS